MPSVDGDNYPGPWEIRIAYTTNFGSGDKDHTMRVSVDVDSDPGPGSAFADYDLKSRAGLYYTAASFVDALVTVVKELYPAAASFNSAELWKYASGTFNAAFQSAYTIGVAGVNGASSHLHGQGILTFRSQNGGSARLNLMEPVLTPGPTLQYPTSTTIIDDVFDFITASQSPVLARDGGYLFAPLNWLPGRNERLFKKDYRD
jgi:hypothetical protein